MSDVSACTGDTMELWTAQQKVVLDAVERDGVSYVRSAYIDQKYEDTAWIFRTAYREFGRLMERRVKKPQEAESPIWLFADRRWVYASPGSFLLRLNVPRGELVTFDLRGWHRILNLKPLGTEEEQSRFDRELTRQGVACSSDLFQTPFYPVLKRQVTDSWRQLFDREPEEAYLQAAVWILRKEWILSAEEVTGRAE